MLTELITLGAIFGGSAVAVLFVKRRLHPQIERSLAELERKDLLELERMDNYHHHYQKQK
jgi:hypothetical protein